MYTVQPHPGVGPRRLLDGLAHLGDVPRDPTAAYAGLVITGHVVLVDHAYDLPPPLANEVEEAAAHAVPVQEPALGRVPLQDLERGRCGGGRGASGAAWRARIVSCTLRMTYTNDII